jgi:hypothetical protein
MSSVAELSKRWTAPCTFAQSSGIDDTMIRLVSPSRRFRGVLDRVQGAQKWAATDKRAAAGVELFQNRTAPGCARCTTN